MAQAVITKMQLHILTIITNRVTTQVMIKFDIDNSNININNQPVVTSNNLNITQSSRDVLSLELPKQPMA